MDDLRRYSQDLSCKGCYKHGNNFKHHIDKHHTEKLPTDHQDSSNKTEATKENANNNNSATEMYKIIDNKGLTPAVKKVSEDMRETRNMRKEKENPIVSPLKMKIKICADKTDTSVPTKESAVKEKSNSNSAKGKGLVFLHIYYFHFYLGV